jgi:hypothetical protein
VATPTYWLCPGCHMPRLAMPAKPKQARNIKDLKGPKCRYTFVIRAALGTLELVRVRAHA